LGGAQDRKSWQIRHRKNDSMEKDTVAGKKGNDGRPSIIDRGDAWGGVRTRKRESQKGLKNGEA